MRIVRLHLENWKNFRDVDVVFQRRVFIVGPNASGKSNLLDSIRFLRDIADPEGGFQRAVRSRGGVSALRCLHARKQPNVAVEVTLGIESEDWTYRVEFKQDSQRRAEVVSEVVSRRDERVLLRPGAADESDPRQLSQTHLEQVNVNQKFRVVAEALARVRYLHVIPQLIREPDRVIARAHDPYGSDFLLQIARTPERTLKSRLKLINHALKVALPQLQELDLEKDEGGVPHLKGLYHHWRPNAGWQREDQFSDGTLRLLGLLWAILDGTEPLLLEEPELSLHAGVVRYVPLMMVSATRKTQRQVVASTHSVDLLSDQGISPDEVLLLSPSQDGTIVQPASRLREVRSLLNAGATIGEVVMPRTAPADAEQLALFGL